jgi:hypothetical protein
MVEKRVLACEISVTTARLFENESYEREREYRRLE